MKIIRNSIVSQKDFVNEFIGGRKLARAATSKEVYLLTYYHNAIIALSDILFSLRDTLADFEERESNLSSFVRERLELDNKKEV